MVWWPTFGRKKTETNNPRFLTRETPGHGRNEHITLEKSYYKTVFIVSGKKKRSTVIEKRDDFRVKFRNVGKERELCWSEKDVTRVR